MNIAKTLAVSLITLSMLACSQPQSDTVDQPMRIVTHQVLNTYNRMKNNHQAFAGYHDANSNQARWVFQCISGNPHRMDQVFFPMRTTILVNPQNNNKTHISVQVTHDRVLWQTDQPTRARQWMQQIIQQSKIPKTAPTTGPLRSEDYSCK